MNKNRRALCVLLPPVKVIGIKYGWKTPQIENHVYNRMLKAIGEMAKIGQLHSHLGATFFATYMLSQGTQCRQNAPDRKNIRTTQRYAKVLAQGCRDDFDKIAAQMTQSSEQKRNGKRNKMGRPLPPLQFNKPLNPKYKYLK